MSLITQRHGMLWAANNGSDPYNPLGLPPFTIRCQFTAGTTPTMGDSQTLVDATDNVWDITKNDTNWTGLFYTDTTLISVLGANTANVTSMRRLFGSCTNLASVALFDTSSVLSIFNSNTPVSMFGSCSSLTSLPGFDFSKVDDLEHAFRGCTNLVSIQDLKTDANTSLNGTFLGCTSLKTAPNMSTSHVTTMGGTFSGCTALESVPLYDTSSVTAFYSSRGGAFYNCSSLKSIPLFDTGSATTVREMFRGCTNVESGALALYQQMSTQTTPPSVHTNTFQNCGSNTVTGAAELAQIPTNWGGTMAV